MIVLSTYIFLTSYSISRWSEKDYLTDVTKYLKPKVNKDDSIYKSGRAGSHILYYFLDVKPPVRYIHINGENETEGILEKN